jgi:peptide deformylase
MEIKRHKEPELFQVAVEVNENEFGKELDEHMSNMLEIMFSKRGVGLAGNQIGDTRRILVADLGYVTGDEDYGSSSIKMVNPVIVSYSAEEVVSEEGCLSYPGLAKSVSRPVAIRIKFKDPFGNEKESIFKDWQARIILHEMDHLDGITLYSRASRMLRSRYDKKIEKLS